MRFGILWFLKTTTMKRFHYIDENNAEQHDKEAEQQWLETYGFKCDKCHGWFEFHDIESITSDENDCTPFSTLKTTCKTCHE